MKQLNIKILIAVAIAFTLIAGAVVIAAGIMLIQDHSPKIEVGTYCTTYAQELTDPQGCKYIVVSDCHGIAIVHSPKCRNH